MSGNYLDLNKRSVRESVVSKLQALGYTVSADSSTTLIFKIQNIIKEIQRNNGLMIDGVIGVRTMPVLGYSLEETKKMLKIHSYKNISFYDYHILLLWS